jgi:hypothetical protein
MTDTDRNMLARFAQRVNYLEELYKDSVMADDQWTARECLAELNDINEAITAIEERNA